MTKRQNTYKILQKRRWGAEKLCLTCFLAFLNVKVVSSCLFLPFPHIQVICDKLSRQGDCQEFSVCAYYAPHVVLLESTLSPWCMLAFIANLSFEILQGSGFVISFPKNILYLLSAKDKQLVMAHNPKQWINPYPWKC